MEQDPKAYLYKRIVQAKLFHPQQLCVKDRYHRSTVDPGECIAAQLVILVF